MQMLSQLSYGPLVASKCSREVEIIGPVDAAALVVSGSREPQMDECLRWKAHDGQPEATVQLGTVSGEGIDLLRRVKPSDEAGSGPPSRTTPNDDDVARPLGPLALDPCKLGAELKDHVVPATLGHRLVDLDSELDRSQGYGRFRDRSFLVRCHASQRSGGLGWARSVCASGPGGYTAARGKGLDDPLSSLDQARRIAGLAEEKLAQDIVILDMRPVCAYTDFFVVCSGQNPRQTKAIFDEVRHGLKHDDAERLLPHSVDGQSQGDWIVADYLDVVLHVFTPETREYYRLEELWEDVPSVEHVAS
jgi:ribosome-associated protein